MGARFDPQRKLGLAEALDEIPGPEGQRFASLFRHGSLEVEVYAPRGRDEQTPHTRDEVYVVIAGRAVYTVEDKRMQVGAGDLLFAAAGEQHRFEDLTSDFLVWVLFYGPEGGEVDGEL